MNVVLRICMQKNSINNAIMLMYNSNGHLVFYSDQFKEKQTRCSDWFKPKFAFGYTFRAWSDSVIQLFMPFGRRLFPVSSSVTGLTNSLTICTTEIEIPAIR